MSKKIPRQMSLSSFVSKHPKVIEKSSCDVDLINMPIQEADTSFSDLLDSQVADSVEITPEKSIVEKIKQDIKKRKVDISQMVGIKLENDVLVSALENIWVPDQNYTFKLNGKYKACYNHLLNFKWLRFSEIENGYFCLSCCVFPPNQSHINSSFIPESLVTKPFVNFKHAMGQTRKLKSHENSFYHKSTSTTMALFLESMANPSKSLELQSKDNFNRKIDENRSLIRPIIECVLLCMRQGIGLRGHREGSFTKIVENCHENLGNFREILAYRAKGDHQLTKALLSASKNASYTSGQIQNEIMSLINEQMREKVFEKMNCSEFFSIGFDESTDLSKKEQMVIVARYYDEQELKVKESFLAFIDCYSDLESIDKDKSFQSLTGENIAKIVLRYIDSTPLNKKKIVGISTDGASVMTSQRCGAIKNLRKFLPNAMHCLCLNHQLNLGVNVGLKNVLIEDVFVVAMDIYNFFRFPKRNTVLSKNIPSNHTLKKICETRWVERFDTVSNLIRLLKYVQQSLIEIQNSTDDYDILNQIQSIKSKIQTPNFLITLTSLDNLMVQVRKLSVILQKEDFDLFMAYQECDFVITKMRNDAEKNFEQIFKDAKILASELGTSILHNRNEILSPNDPKSPQNLYKRILFRPIIDSFLKDFESRLDERDKKFSLISKLHPVHVQSISDEEISELNDTFATIISNREPEENKKFLLDEIEDYKILSRNISKESSLVEVYQKLPMFLILIRKLFKIFVVLPVSNASGERGFSTLKNIKTWQRTTMCQNRLSDIAMAYSNKEIRVDVDEIIDEFAIKKARKLNFLIS